MIKNIKGSGFVFTILAAVIFIAVFFVFSFSGCKEEIPKELSVYAWEGYLPEDAVQLFEEETGIKLNITYATDNDVMLTLLKGGGTADLLMPTQNQVNRFYEAELAQPLDTAKLPNYKNVPESLRNQPWAKYDGQSMGSGEIYVVPYVFGTSGLVINTGKYSLPADGLGWEVLFDEALKGRVSSKNAPESLMLTLDMMGVPREELLTDTENTLLKARDNVLVLKSNVLKFWDSGTEILDMLKNEEVWVSHIWDGGGRKMTQFDPKFIYVLPKTGGLGWTDTLMIPENALNPEGAHMLIDFMLRPETAALVTIDSGYTTTVEGALEKAEQTGSFDAALYRFTEEELANLIWQPNFSEDVIAAYTDFWEEISTVE